MLEDGAVPRTQRHAAKEIVPSMVSAHRPCPSDAKFAEDGGWWLMPHVINLTLPFYVGMPVGNVWASDAPFRSAEVTTYAANGARIQHISMMSESGTRVMMQACYDPASPKVGEMDLGQLVDIDTLVVDIPKGAGEEITAADIDRTVSANPEYRRGDALLIRTGWGDDERYRKLGDDYAVKTPHFAVDGSLRLAEVMHEKGSDTLAVDMAYIGNCAPFYMVPEWVNLPPWLRPPFPAEEARIYIRHYLPFKSRQDWAASRPLHAAGFIIAALCNAGQIKARRVRLTALPLFIERVPGAPVTVVAIED